MRTKFSDGQLTTALAAIEMLRGRHRRVAEIRMRLRRDLDSLGREADRLGREVEQRDAQILEQRAAADRLGHEVEQRDAQILEQRAAADRLLREIEQRDAQILEQRAAADRLRREIEKRDAQILEQCAAANQLEREVEQRDAQVLEQRAAADRLEREVNHRNAQIAELSVQLLTGANDLARVSQENQALRASTSWRVTWPLRGARELQRRLIPRRLPEAVPPVARATETVSEPRSSDRAGDFDREFYLKMYPDVAAAGCDPEEHYWQNGKAEGRLGYLPQLDLVGSLALFSKERETVLVVSHEASLTGAPVLSLNIVQQLSSRYNVVAMLLWGGVIGEAFHEAGAVVVRASAARGNPVWAEVITQALSQQVDFKFALVNSIESRWVLPGLAKCGVPTVTLIHEFAAYIRPKGAFLDALLWLTEIVFSTEITFESTRAELAHIEDWPSVRIFPQGRCTIPTLEVDTQRLSNERARVVRALRPSGYGDRKFIVLGAGTVQFRKGVDIFIQCAAHVLSQIGADSARFVWIGGGFDPDQDAGYSVYLADQIRRAGLQDMVVFVRRDAGH